LPTTLVTVAIPLATIALSCRRCYCLLCCLGIDLVALDLTFFVAVPIALAALAITLLPPLPLPFAIALFVTRHFVAITIVHIFAVAIARWQQRGNKDNGGNGGGGGGKYNNQLKRGRPKQRWQQKQQQ
jgi:hypothetical protein